MRHLISQGYKNNDRMFFKAPAFCEAGAFIARLWVYMLALKPEVGSSALDRGRMILSCLKKKGGSHE